MHIPTGRSLSKLRSLKRLNALPRCIKAGRLFCEKIGLPHPARFSSQHNSTIATLHAALPFPRAMP